jgi:hypothetical protein
MDQPGKSLAFLRWVMLRISNPRPISGQAIELYTVQQSAMLADWPERGRSHYGEERGRAPYSAACSANIPIVAIASWSAVTRRLCAGTALDADSAWGAGLRSIGKQTKE